MVHSRSLKNTTNFVDKDDDKKKQRNLFHGRRRVGHMDTRSNQNCSVCWTSLGYLDISLFSGWFRSFCDVRARFWDGNDKLTSGHTQHLQSGTKRRSEALKPSSNVGASMTHLQQGRGGSSHSASLGITWFKVQIRLRGVGFQTGSLVLEHTGS